MSTLKEKAEQILQEKQEKIIPENFSSNLEIFDVQGNIYTAGGMSYYYDSFEHNEYIKDYTFYSPDMRNSYPNGIYIKPQENYDCKLGVNISESTLANIIDLTADKIKKDEVILGITGTYEGSGSKQDTSLIPVSFVVPDLLVISSWDSSIYNGMYYDCSIDYEDEIVVLDKDNKAIRKNISMYIFLDPDEGGEYYQGQFNISYRFSNSGIVQNQLIEYFGITLEVDKVYSCTLRAQNPYNGSCIQQAITLKFIQREE